MNPYYYLFYRFNQYLNKKKDNEWGVIYAMTVLPGWNIIIIYINTLPITQENLDGTYKTILIVIACAFFILNSVLFLNKTRVSRIMKRYQNESETSRKIGGVIIILYIIFSVGLVVFI